MQRPTVSGPIRALAAGTPTGHRVFGGMITRAGAITRGNPRRGGQTAHGVLDIARREAPADDLRLLVGIRAA